MVVEGRERMNLGVWVGCRDILGNRNNCFIGFLLYEIIIFFFEKLLEVFCYL